MTPVAARAVPAMTKTVESVALLRASSPRSCARIASAAVAHVVPSQTSFASLHLLLAIAPNTTPPTSAAPPTPSEMMPYSLRRDFGGVGSGSSTSGFSIGFSIGGVVVTGVVGTGLAYGASSDVVLPSVSMRTFWDQSG